MVHTNTVVGMISAIQRFSLHDGPGIRTTVFLKGCNLRCKWCHNPETINGARQILYFEDKCIGCGKCYKVCEYGCHSVYGGHKYNRQNCTSCGRCIMVCPTKALEQAGYIMGVNEVMKEVIKDIPLYSTSGGGVTLSGGEPLLQADFLMAMLKECKKNNIHTAVDTAGNVDWLKFYNVIPEVDLFLYDLKVVDAKKHKLLTGSDNRLIFENLSKLASCAEVLVRMPLVSKLNDKDEDIIAAVDILKKAGIKRVELLKYHALHKPKYSALGLEAPELFPPDDTRMNYILELMGRSGIEATAG
jgi:glycyl-radical enzyme activating protein family